MILESSFFIPTITSALQLKLCEAVSAGPNGLNQYQNYRGGGKACIAMQAQASRVTGNLLIRDLPITLYDS